MPPSLKEARAYAAQTGWRALYGPGKKRRRQKARVTRNRRRDAYMQSRTWARLRQAVLARDGHRCALCHHSRRLEVHHVHYRTLYAETGTELVTLCRYCHQAEHRVGRQKREGYWLSQKAHPLKPISLPSVSTQGTSPCSGQSAATGGGRFTHGLSSKVRSRARRTTGAVWCCIEGNGCERHQTQEAPLPD